MTMTEDASRDATWTNRPGMPNNPTRGETFNPAPEEFEFNDIDGTPQLWTKAAVLKAADPIILDGQLKQCKVCGKIVGSTGFGGHWRAHLVTIGAKPKVVPGKRGPNKPKNKIAAEDAEPRTPKATQKLSVDDACIGMLMGMTGKRSIPIDKVPAVSAWIEQTKHLMKDL